MARIRSPGYPNASLKEAIDFAKKIHEADYTHPVSRETAARHMGFSGTSGTSDRAISALMHYGLAQKAAKGEVQLTRIAVDILHPNSDSDRRRALKEAAFSPDLFKELRERYPGRLPSEESLTTYLFRQGFAQRAVGPAARAYLDTCQFLQQEQAYDAEAGTAGRETATPSFPESSVAGNSFPESSATAKVERVVTTQTKSATPEQAPPTAEGRLNEVWLTVDGSKATIRVTFDKNGLKRIMKKLEVLEQILDDPEQNGDIAPPHSRAESRNPFD